jgi:hypothetical protein
MFRHLSLAAFQVIAEGSLGAFMQNREYLKDPTEWLSKSKLTDKVQVGSRMPNPADLKAQRLRELNGPDYKAPGNTDAEKAVLGGIRLQGGGLDGP